MYTQLVKRVIAVLLLLLCGTAATHAGQLVLFNENPFNGAARGFYSVDLNNNYAITLVSEVPFVQGDRYEGFGWNPADNRLYSGSAAARLYAFNWLAGSSAPVGQVPVVAGEFIRGITVQPGTNQMFGFGFGPRLYQIDHTDASSSLVGLSPNLDSGIAFHPDGRLFGFSPQQRLLQIDPATAVGTVLSQQINDPVSDVDFTDTGRFFGVNYSNGSLIEYDLTTGVGTERARYSGFGNGLMGIFYVTDSVVPPEGVPEPSTVALAAIGLLGVGLVAWRRRKAVRDLLAQETP